MATKGRLLIIGAGISGLTAAAGLGQRGWTVDVIERKAEVSDGGGVGLSLVANAVRALDRIGVAEACVAAGIPADRIAVLNPRGELLAENPLPRIGGPEWPGATGIRRADFHDILVRAARPVSDMRCGITVDRWTDDGAGVDVRFSDGRADRYDLVIGADGLYSAMRAVILPDVRPHFTGQACWRVPVSRPAGVRCTHLFLGGRHGVVGVCPVSEDLAYMYIVQHHDGSWRDPATLDAQMRAELEGYGGIITECAREISDPAAVSFRPLEAMLAPSPWGRGRIVLIGDAVHANPPVLAQGAAMGIEDALVLADVLDAAPGDVPGALDRFIARRFDRVRHVVDSSCQLAQWEVEGRRDIDIGGYMRASTQRLAEAI